MDHYPASPFSSKLPLSPLSLVPTRTPCPAFHHPPFPIPVAFPLNAVPDKKCSFLPFFFFSFFGFVLGLLCFIGWGGGRREKKKKKKSSDVWPCSRFFGFFFLNSPICFTLCHFFLALDRPCFRGKGSCCPFLFFPFVAFFAEERKKRKEKTHHPSPPPILPILPLQPIQAHYPRV